MSREEKQEGPGWGGSPKGGVPEEDAAPCSVCSAEGAQIGPDLELSKGLSWASLEGLSSRATENPFRGLSSHSGVMH
jgi:hypothetical protein